MDSKETNDLLIPHACNLLKRQLEKEITIEDFFLYASRWSGHDSTATAYAHFKTYQGCGTYPDYVLSYAHHVSEQHHTNHESAPYGNVRSLRAAPKRGDQSSTGIDLNRKRGKRPQPSKGDLP